MGGTPPPSSTFPARMADLLTLNDFLKFYESRAQALTIMPGVLATNRDARCPPPCPTNVAAVCIGLQWGLPLGAAD